MGLEGTGLELSLRVRSSTANRWTWRDGRLWKREEGRRKGREEEEKTDDEERGEGSCDGEQLIGDT